MTRTKKLVTLVVLMALVAILTTSTAMANCNEGIHAEENEVFQAVEGLHFRQVGSGTIDWNDLVPKVQWKILDFEDFAFGSRWIRISRGKVFLGYPGMEYELSTAEIIRLLAMMDAEVTELPNGRFLMNSMHLPDAEIYFEKEDLATRSAFLAAGFQYVGYVEGMQSESYYLWFGSM